MLQLNQSNMNYQPRPNVPPQGLPSMPALNLPHPPVQAQAPAPPSYAPTASYGNSIPPPVYNNMVAPPPVPGNGHPHAPLPPVAAPAPPPAYYNPAPPFVPHSPRYQVSGGPPPPVPMATSATPRGMPTGGNPISPPAQATPTPVQAPTPAPPAPSTNSRKRKSDVADTTQEDLFPEDAPEIDSDDERLERLDSDTCNTIRRKIRNWIDSGAQKVGEFQRTIGVSGKAYNSFMNRTGTWDGDGTDTFAKAHHFFKKRELQGLPLKANKPKKPKTAAASKATDEILDVSNVDPLPGEAQGTVPVYDTCNEIRKKIRPLLAKEGMTQAAFIRALNKNLPEGKSVSQANLRYFMGRTGARDGNTNITFYAAYVFFEKKRIQAGKPKSKFREEMEKAWGAKGFDLEHGANQHYTCFAGERPVQDKYGKIDFVDVGAFR